MFNCLIFCPLVNDEDKHKMSKRDDVPSMLIIELVSYALFDLTNHLLKPVTHFYENKKKPTYSEEQINI